MSDTITHEGGCHCGKVRYQVTAPADLTVYECNCSMCRMIGFLHLPATNTSFTLLQGAEDLSTYTFNTHKAKHLFCRHCGVKSYYIPRSNPDGFTVNARCLDRDSVKSMTVLPFDGANWEEHIDDFKASVEAQLSEQDRG